MHKNAANLDVWYVYFKSMLKNANSILNELFEEYQDPVAIDNEETAASSSSSQPSLTKSEHVFAKLSKDVENLDVYFKKTMRRFDACCSALTNLLEPLNERVVIKVRPNEVIALLKRVFTFDYKKLVRFMKTSIPRKLKINKDSN